MTIRQPHPHRPVRHGAAGVLAVLVLASCSSTGTDAPSSVSPTTGASSARSSGATTGTASGSGPTTSSGPSSSSPAGADGAMSLSVTVTGKKVDPAPSVVKLAVGQVLRLTVTSDHADELHAHGFEKEAELVAGQPTTLELSTDQPGTYEVETHHPPLRLLKVQVR